MSNSVLDTKWIFASNEFGYFNYLFVDGNYIKYFLKHQVIKINLLTIQELTVKFLFYIFIFCYLDLRY